MTQFEQQLCGACQAGLHELCESTDCHCLLCAPDPDHLPLLIWPLPPTEVPARTALTIEIKPRHSSFVCDVVTRADLDGCLGIICFFDLDKISSTRLEHRVIEAGEVMRVGLWNSTNAQLVGSAILHCYDVGRIGFDRAVRAYNAWLKRQRRD